MSQGGIWRYTKLQQKQVTRKQRKGRTGRLRNENVWGAGGTQATLQSLKEPTAALFKILIPDSSLNQNSKKMLAFPPRFGLFTSQQNNYIKSY